MYNFRCYEELSKYEFPMNPKYFSEDVISQNMEIPCGKPDIKKILSINANIDVVSMRIIETPIDISNEGKKLSGCALLVELKFSENIKYVENTSNQKVYLACYDNILKSISVIIPCNINCVDVRELLRKEKIRVTPIIEDISTKVIDLRNIFQSIIYFVNVIFLD